MSAAGQLIQLLGSGLSPSPGRSTRSLRSSLQGRRSSERAILQRSTAKDEERGVTGIAGEAVGEGSGFDLDTLRAS